MRLLVTGGAGFIGSNFIRYILKTYPNYEVINLDLLTYAGNLENLSDIENDSRYIFVHGDICDQKKVDSVVQDVDIVVNFAAESHVDRSIRSDDVFLKTNVLGTKTLLESCRKYGNKRFHHISTDEVYGSLELYDEPFNENSVYSPRSPYSATKAASDHLVRAYFHTYQLPITISNCSNNYGTYQFPEKLHGLAITNLLEGKKVPVYGDGQQRRDWLYVDDHCRAIDLILHKGKLGHTYCVGTGEDQVNLDVVKEILTILDLPDDKIEFVKDRAGHDRRYSIDYSKIKTELGWTPQVSFAEGMKRTVAWYKNNEKWWRRIKDGSYRQYYEDQYLKRELTEKNMKVLIIGKGWLGQRCAELWPNTTIVDRKISLVSDVLDLLEIYKPDVVLNAAGVTGRPNVDWCETNQMETIKGNTILPLIIAEACQKKDIYLLHIGSGCVFYGESPDPIGWREDDVANPSATYSRTKYAADLVLTTLPNIGIARIRMPVDDEPSPRNLISKITTYSKIIDVENSMTIIPDMIDVFYKLLQKKATGIFHVTNPGTIKHREIIDLYHELVDPNHTCEWISNEALVEQGLATKIRSNNFLQSERLMEIGISMRPIKEAMRDIMVGYAEKFKNKEK